MPPTPPPPPPLPPRPRTRIPSASDFAPLAAELTVSLVFPDPPESTTAILILLHGLGDAEAAFAAFARNLALPGVLAVAVRGVHPLPPALVGHIDDDDDDDDENNNGLRLGPTPQTRHFYWGDDLTLARAGGDLDPDPGFDKAERLVLGRLVRETLVGRCGWETEDVLLFGFGQGGSLALGLASRLRVGPPVVEQEGEEGAAATGRAFKGAVSVGGPLLPSTIPSARARTRAATPVLLCHGARSDVVDEEAVEVLKREFAHVRVAAWKRPDDGMPRNREEMLPIMQFFADRLRGGGG
ncbi:hypothetical protein P8C59_007958 [Phyllachora maydis]|uniref:Serine hydrolase domain-containing protein n=1 Tax=Phyllachora maydis TaxID=1825666 RepID=A0AAD9IAT4_9PEZI|nr:hypothetical protein P8C59_007958 [Phyllachora maydis]